jgi:hypothetical protein
MGTTAEPHGNAITFPIDLCPRGKGKPVTCSAIQLPLTVTQVRGARGSESFVALSAAHQLKPISEGQGEGCVVRVLVIHGSWLWRHSWETVEWVCQLVPMIVNQSIIKFSMFSAYTRNIPSCNSHTYRTDHALQKTLPHEYQLFSVCTKVASMSTLYVMSQPFRMEGTWISDWI